MNGRSKACAATAVLAVVALAYWPALRGDFVWDDVVNFRYNTWLTEGDNWKHYVLRDFNYWTHYFRPLVVACFTIQLRLFDGAPAPMHAVSLALHLLNTLLVGLLALRCSQHVGRAAHALPMSVAMTLFGLHPALIEPIAWVGSQYDLFLAAFTLLGLLASTILGPATRPLATAACFFLAACTKESAIAFPLMLVAFDWTWQSRQPGDEARLPSSSIRRFLARNAPTYAAVLLAGLAYLAFRHWALGDATMPPTDMRLSGLERFQIACASYLRYWTIILMPALGEPGPLHPFDATVFSQLTPTSLSVDLAAIGIAVLAGWYALRRGSAFACIVLMITLALLPVLRVLPAAFDPNFYHYRYLTCGLAAACGMLPLLSPRLPNVLRAVFTPRLSALVGAAIACAWMGSSILTIRTTLPLWSNQISLWKWALETHPDSIYATNSLLASYLDYGQLEQATALADRVLAERIPCANCMLNVAELAIAQGDPTRAAIALDAVATSKEDITATADFRKRHARALGRLEQLERSIAAEDASTPQRRLPTEATNP